MPVRKHPNRFLASIKCCFGEEKNEVLINLNFHIYVQTRKFKTWFYLSVLTIPAKAETEKATRLPPKFKFE